jgi:uncharacterized RDD family membrane protein YckC
VNQSKQVISEPAGIGRRLASLLYESMLLFAVVFVAGFLFVAFAREADAGLARLVFQAYLFTVCGIYFVYCWTRGGQTLAMRTWRIRLVTSAGTPLSAAQAFLRYVLAIPSVGTGLGLLWALFDRDRQFLHDRLAGTRIVKAEG